MLLVMHQTPDGQSVPAARGHRSLFQDRHSGQAVHKCSAVARVVRVPHEAHWLQRSDARWVWVARVGRKAERGCGGRVLHLDGNPYRPDWHGVVKCPHRSLRISGPAVSVTEAPKTSGRPGPVRLGSRTCSGPWMRTVMCLVYARTVAQIVAIPLRRDAARGTSDKVWGL